jgi:cation diffusion facilitator CzcD-associated flavoprotein CzcO
VAVIGSGATAITMVPALVEGGAEHTTMIQRSPTYIVPLPAKENFSSLLPRVLGWFAGGPHIALRWMHLVQGYFFYFLCVFFPAMMKKTIYGWSWGSLKAFSKGGVHNPADPHFAPTYNPWEQRLCVCPE